MTNAIENNKALSAFNGSILILAIFCVVFLVIHLWAAGVRDHLSMRKWLFALPLGMQVAVATLVVCSGEFVTRLAIWWWRWGWSGDPAALGHVEDLLIFGAALLACGLLCVLRVVSRPFGAWPVVAAGFCVVGYLVTFLPIS